jgi:hypothetical protein
LLFILHLTRPSQEELERQRQQQALMTLTQDLDLKKKVVLIGEKGSPGYFVLKTDKAVAKIVEASDGAFSVQDWDHGLVELVPDPRLERYRFSAEVRHEKQTNQESRVGIYFGLSEHLIGETLKYYHCNVAFNDLVDCGPPDANGVHQGNLVALQIYRQPQVGEPEQKAFVFNVDTRFLPARPVGALGPWRKIAVEVRPDSIKLFWQSRCFATTPRAALMMSARPLIPRPEVFLPNNPPQFAPRDGLGLFVSQGVASFRNVTVEPIGDEN